jgi:hypothetical protein
VLGRLLIAAVIRVTDVVLLAFGTFVLGSGAGSAATLADSMGCELFALPDAGWRWGGFLAGRRGWIVDGGGWETSWVQGERRWVCGGALDERVDVIVVYGDGIPLRRVVGHGGRAREEVLRNLAAPNEKFDKFERNSRKTGEARAGADCEQLSSPGQCLAGGRR